MNAREAMNRGGGPAPRFEGRLAARGGAAPRDICGKRKTGV